MRPARARVVGYWVQPDPVYKQVAHDQFIGANVFETPADLVEFYNLPLLPKPVPNTKGGGSPKWWTDKID